MTLQRMARENSEATQKASYEFSIYLKSLKLTEKWSAYTWCDNIFDVAIVKGKPRIKYKEYRTENEYGLYDFNENGKLHYYDEKAKNIKFEIELIGLYLSTILFIAIFFMCPVIGIFTAISHAHLIIAVALLGIPLILWILSWIFGWLIPAE